MHITISIICTKAKAVRRNCAYYKMTCTGIPLPALGLFDAIHMCSMSEQNEEEKKHTQIIIPVIINHEFTIIWNTLELS